MTIAEIEKINAAWHEAGHLVVCAIHHGHMARGHIWFESNKGDESLSEWRGQCEGVMPSPEVGVAGIVAELMHEDADICSFEIMNYWDLDVIRPSDSDMKSIPDSEPAREAAIETALTILRANFPLLQEVAGLLADTEDGHGVITDGMMKECIERFSR